MISALQSRPQVVLDDHPGMLERNWGRIIFIASESGLVVPPGMIHYGMTKPAN